MTAESQAQVAQALAQAAQALAQAAQQPIKQPASPLDEAARAVLDKETKLNLAQQAVWVDDSARLAQADRDKVRRLENLQLFGGEAEPGKPEGDVGDIIVCDDYNASKNQGGTMLPGRNVPLLLGGAGLLGAGLVTALVMYTRPTVPLAPVPPAPVLAQPQPTPTAPALQAYDAVTEQWDPATASWREIKRERLK